MEPSPEDEAPPDEAPGHVAVTASGETATPVDVGHDEQQVLPAGEHAAEDALRRLAAALAASPPEPSCGADDCLSADDGGDDDDDDLVAAGAASFAAYLSFESAVTDGRCDEEPPLACAGAEQDSALDAAKGEASDRVCTFDAKAEASSSDESEVMDVEEDIEPGVQEEANRRREYSDASDAFASYALSAEEDEEFYDVVSAEFSDSEAEAPPVEEAGDSEDDERWEEASALMDSVAIEVAEIMLKVRSATGKKEKQELLARKRALETSEEYLAALRCIEGRDSDSDA